MGSPYLVIISRFFSFLFFFYTETYLFISAIKGGKKGKEEGTEMLYLPLSSIFPVAPLSRDKLVLEIRGHLLCLFTCSLHTVGSSTHTHKDWSSCTLSELIGAKGWVILAVPGTARDPNDLWLFKLWVKQILCRVSWLPFVTEHWGQMTCPQEYVWANIRDVNVKISPYDNTSVIGPQNNIYCKKKKRQVKTSKKCSWRLLNNWTPFALHLQSL